MRTPSSGGYTSYAQGGQANEPYGDTRNMYPARGRADMHVEDGTDTERQYGSNMMPPAQHIGMFNIPQSELAERSP